MRPDKSRQHGAFLFSIAVIADTHLNQNDHECNSPFAVNRRANNRLRYTIADLNARELAMVVHLGDVVHPVPSMQALYAQSARRFFTQVSALRHPFFIIPGNHDVGDKPLSWGPAGGVRDDFLRAWSEHFGEHYFHHAHDPIHFIGINAQLFGSGLEMEAEQAAWLQARLNELHGQRIFIASHYPPYLLHAAEAEHYDNLSPTARAWLLGLLRRHKVEALFCGHVHNYWFNRIGGTDCHLLPSTAFVRQDYSEMFRIAGKDDEYGRDDRAKLGYLLLHIFERGHGVELIRTDGNEIAQTSGGESAQAENSPRQRLSKKPQFAGFRSNLGFSLRHDWMEITQIPPSGALDEFERKAVRNDYGLLAFLDMGVRRLRLPLSDVTESVRRRRLADLAHLGFCYRFYSFDLPDKAVCKLIAEHRDWIDSWEICAHSDSLINAFSARTKKPGHDFFAFAESIDLPLIFSPLRRRHDTGSSGKIYYHVVNHGFSVDAAAAVTAWCESAVGMQFCSYALRLHNDESVASAMEFARTQFARFGKTAAIQMRFAADNPAQNMDDEVWLCRRLAEAALLAHSQSSCDVFCDLFADTERGYFPHTGIVDRRYNPRAGLNLLKNLHTLLMDAPSGQPFALAQHEYLLAFAITDSAWVCVPERPWCIQTAWRQLVNRDAGQWRVIDLISGEIQRVEAVAQRKTESAMPFVLVRQSAPA